MKQRCENPNNTVYTWYGDLGIDVCSEWKHSFELFEDWALSHGYAENLTIDRINYNKGYCPENCRWVTRKEQSRNRRDNHLIEYNGKIQTLIEWAEETGIHQKTLWYRVTHGWPVERALTEPTHSEFRRHLITFRNESRSLYEWARIYHIRPGTLSARLHHGWSVEEALLTPVIWRG